MTQMDMKALWGSLGVDESELGEQAQPANEPEPKAVVKSAAQMTKAERTKARNQLLKGLDPKQKRAAVSKADHLLVVAGAGSGKTRVFVHRIARLVLEGMEPDRILALSYTNAAANEVKKRLAEMGVVGVQTSTLHAWCNREPLRKFGHLIGQARYQILDAEGQAETLQYDMRLGEHGAKRVQSELTVVKNFIDESAGGSWHVEEYNAILAKRGQLDFDDLQVKALEVLSNHPEVVLHYRESLDCVLIDEYQDVNPVQHEILRLLCAPLKDDDGNDVRTPMLCCVGDGDQSVMSFRGSSSEYIETFLDEFPGSSQIIMDQNYRSTDLILKAANRIIKGNDAFGRITKNMWTHAGDGEPIKIEEFSNEVMEAAYVADHIKDLIADGVPTDEIAVLYRMHRQADVIAEYLEAARIPFWQAANDEQTAMTTGRKGVVLRTIHSAKGLEWEAVVLIGWSDGIIPSWGVKKDPSQMPEERRIAYVAVTRGKRHVLITSAKETRTKAGGTMSQPRSRFLDVIEGKPEQAPASKGGWGSGSKAGSKSAYAGATKRRSSW